MGVNWLALSALTTFLAFAGDVQAGTRGADLNISAAYDRADQDFSAKAKYAKKQTDTWGRTKKYR